MRLFGRLRRRGGQVVRYADDDTLAVLVRADDAARADSGVLAEAAGVDWSVPLLVRHHLLGLPDAAAVQRARELLAQDGYALTVSAGSPPYAARAFRTQLVTALSLAQERSRMAGLAQRLGGDVAGYDILGPRDGPAGDGPGPGAP